MEIRNGGAMWTDYGVNNRLKKYSEKFIQGSVW